MNVLFPAGQPEAVEESLRRLGSPACGGSGLFSKKEIDQKLV